MNREKSEAKFICIPDCHAFKMDLWCAGHLVRFDFINVLVNVNLKKNKLITIQNSKYLASYMSENNENE
jgi:hypothetical protein